MKIRDILEELSGDALKRLCDVRGLSYGRRLHDRLSNLSRSYQGRIEDLLLDLRREDLICVLDVEWFCEHHRPGASFRYTNLSRGSREQLEELGRRHFIKGWEPKREGERPMRSAPFETCFLEVEDEEDPQEENPPSGVPEAALTEEEYLGGDAYRTEAHHRQFWQEVCYDAARVHPPRPYQADATAAALAGLNPEQPKLLHVATGGGKTFIANNVVVQHLTRTEGWVLWVTKDWRLLYQAAGDIARRNEGYAHRLCRMGGDQSLLYPLPTGHDPGTVVYTTLHSLRSRIPELKRMRERPSLIVWDECHWAEAGALGRTLLKWAHGHSPVLGLTATPRVEDESHFESVFRMDFATLVQKGVLAAPEPHEPLRTGVTWNARRAAAHLDFTGDSLRTLASHRKRNNFIVEHYVQHQARYGKTMLFACTIEHANTLATMLVGRGVPARPVHSHLDGRLNDESLARFRRGEVQVLTNVAMLTHGVDVPDARSVFLCRPTLSDILYAQMIGRASRRDAGSGKDTFHIVEFVDLSEFREQLVTAKHYFSGASFGRTATTRTAPASTRPASARVPRLTFDPTGAPTWIPDTPDVPTFMRGLWYRQNQSFGLEFEFTSDDFSEDMGTRKWKQVAEPLRERLTAALPPGAVADAVLPEYLGSAQKDHHRWNVERDNSCGWEVTSRVLANEAGFREVATACTAIAEAAEDLGLRVNYRTGLHVHLGWLGKSAEEVKRAVRLAKHFEPAAATLVGPSRLVSFDGQRYDLSSPNLYCQPVSTAFPARRLARASTVEQLLAQVDNHDARYVTFNIRPLSDIHTVEVRMHSGTMDAAKALLWLSLWMQVLWAAASTQEVPEAPDVEVIAPTGDILSLARSYLPAVQQEAFLRRLDARRREVAQGWERVPVFEAWREFARRWVPPL
ncbi:helicase-related protein [Corallococcus sp. AS-1-12]|uniref:helicase-related protein n=1 Tax=Corallococcus sp. AS-1-12 TaxID=2874598 RepID=UPI001CBF7B3E|nr:helicase-related protein [Corallococcus sp. AS-1-12]MBZ4336553.1 DEAD/DEAH box helicase family protein [Corallococcus sp. AS-1-12]